MSPSELRGSVARLAADEEVPLVVREALAGALHRILTVDDLEMLLVVARESLAGFLSSTAAVDAIATVSGGRE
jgi:hypothetical protein